MQKSFVIYLQFLHFFVLYFSILQVRFSTLAVKGGKNKAASLIQRKTNEATYIGK